jgi:hypothetical protein
MTFFGPNFGRNLIIGIVLMVAAAGATGMFIGKVFL